MPEKITITKLYRSTKDKGGVEFKTKDGRPYERVSIKCQEYGDKWVSGFGSYWNKNWKEGDIVELKIEKKGEYINFSKVDELTLLSNRITALENNFEALRKMTLNEGFKKNDTPKETLNEVDYPGPADEPQF